jgi:hypothetical protein
MARTALAAENAQEALSYYNRVLELDPSLSEAWIGKGRAAGWQSTLADMRIREMLIAFKHGLATASAPDKEELLMTCVDEVNRLVVAIYTMARQQLVEFVAVEAAWTNYIAQIGILLDGLEEVHSWAPSDRATLENTVHLCKDNIEGIKFRDPYDNNISKGWVLSDEYEPSSEGDLTELLASLPLSTQPT